MAIDEATEYTFSSSDSTRVRVDRLTWQHFDLSLDVGGRVIVSHIPEIEQASPELDKFDLDNSNVSMSFRGGYLHVQKKTKRCSVDGCGSKGKNRYNGNNLCDHHLQTYTARQNF